MSITGYNENCKDTVEEFWDKEILERCIEMSERVDVEDFLMRLKTFLGVSGTIRAAPSCRVALEAALAGTFRLARTRGDAVLICSFNCPAVCHAATRAGLSVETFDLADISGRIDWEAVSTRLTHRHHAVVVPHLFGVPSDFRPVQEAAAKLGVIVIEDCAHTLGGKIGSAVAGSVGDIAVFSFNYDKPISMGGGGALLVNNHELKAACHPPQVCPSKECEIKELGQFTAFIEDRRGNIRRKGLMARAANRVLGRRKIAHKMVEPCGFGSVRAALGIWNLDHYPRIVEHRNRNAAAFSDISQWRAWNVARSVEPAWLKQKIMPLYPADVLTISQRLRDRGLRVGCFNWPETVDQELLLPAQPNADFVAHNGLDSPLHQRIGTEDINLIREVLEHTWLATARIAGLL